MAGTAEFAENELHNLYLAGVGTNLGCYGSIMATPDKLQELVETAELIEARIGRKLDIISGGSTTSLPAIVDGTIPERINMVRVGEGILLSEYMTDIMEYNMDYLFRDVFTLRAEIVEVRDKPTYPGGRHHRI